MREPPIIEPRQRFDVIVQVGQSPDSTERYSDAGFSISANGVLSVSTADGKQAKAWAVGQWLTVEVVASDG